MEIDNQVTQAEQEWGGNPQLNETESTNSDKDAVAQNSFSKELRTNMVRQKNLLAYIESTIPKIFVLITSFLKLQSMPHCIDGY